MAMAMVLLASCASIPATPECRDALGNALLPCPVTPKANPIRVARSSFDRRPTHAVQRYQPRPLVSLSTRSAGAPTALAMVDLSLNKDPAGRYRGRRPGYRFDIDDEGNLHFDPSPAVSPEAAVGLGVAMAFDVAEALVRIGGLDPCAYDKVAVEDVTTPLRERLARGHRGFVLSQAASQVKSELEALDQRTDLTPAALHETLFRRWDGLPEDQGALEDEKTAQARAQIMKFAAHRFPAGTAAAFTAEELERFNAQRRSHQVFSPYPLW